MLRLTGGQVLRGGELLDDDLWVDLASGKIVDPMRRFYEAASSEELRCDEQVVDCSGKVLAPGFIDLQCNGGFGVDFSSEDDMGEGALEEYAKRVLETGVTAFCPTLISLEPKEYAALIPRFRESDGRETGAASVLGLHLEGPFFSKAKIGAHAPGNIKTPADWPIEDVYGKDLSSVRIITLAPELEGSLEAVRTLATGRGPRGRIVSMGHSSANLAQADAGVEAGATMITHLFNAMGGFHHRDPGIIGLLGRHEQHDKISYGIIADGLHAAPVSVAMAYQSHPRGVVLVTDAMAATGLPEGEYHLGAQHVEVRRASGGEKCAVLKGTETLAGSVVQMDECVRNFQKFTGCSLPQALEAATLHPARALGIEARKGTLDFGADGDVVVLDRDSLQVQRTFISGKQVFATRACHDEPSSGE